MRRLSAILTVFVFVLFAQVAGATVATSTSRVQYNCDGLTNTYAFTFGVSATSEVSVILTTSAGTETTLTETTHYTVSAANSDYSSGGTVTTVSTYASGNKITVLRSVPLTQASDFTEGMPTLYQTFENSLDKLTRIAQQQDEKLARVPMLPKSATVSAPPLANPVAGQYLRWNLTADGIESTASVSTTGNFTQSGTGAVARTVDSKIGEFVSVKDFGATGDGVTNDAAAIQAALDAASNVYLPAGNYLITTTISVASNKTLRGAGKNLSIFLIGTAGMVGITPVTSASNINLEDFGITGTDPGTDNNEKGIYATTCTNLHVRRVFIEKVPYGVKYDGCIRSSVTDSDFFDTAGNTTQGTAVLLGADAEEIIVSRNTFKTIKRHAVYLSTGTRNSTVSANVIDGCGQACINMNSDSTDNPNSYNTITGNTMRNGTASGIYMQNYNQYNTVSNNTIETVGAYGIGMTGAVDHATERPSYNVISGNVIKAPTNHGIWISNGDENIVTSNLIETSAQTGIVITTSGSDVGSYSYRNTVANNIVRNSGRGLNISGNATTTRVSDNTLYNNTTNNYYLAAGTGTLFREVFYVDNSDHATSGTGEDTLATVTIPAYYLGPNGILKVTAAGTKTGSSGNKTIKIYWNNNAYTFNAAANDTNDWRVEMIVANTALGTQRITWMGWNGVTPLQGYEAQSEGTNANVTVKLTGECANAGDTVTQTMLLIERL